MYVYKYFPPLHAMSSMHSTTTGTRYACAVVSPSCLEAASIARIFWFSASSWATLASSSLHFFFRACPPLRRSALILRFFGMQTMHVALPACKRRVRLIFNRDAIDLGQTPIEAFWSSSWSTLSALPPLGLGRVPRLRRCEGKSRPAWVAPLDIQPHQQRFQAPVPPSSGCLSNAT